MDTSSKSKFGRTKTLALSLLITLGAIGTNVASGVLTSWTDPSG